MCIYFILNITISNLRHKTLKPPSDSMYSSEIYTFSFIATSLQPFFSSSLCSINLLSTRLLCILHVTFQSLHFVNVKFPFVSCDCVLSFSGDIMMQLSECWHQYSWKYIDICIFLFLLNLKFTIYLYFFMQLRLLSHIR